MPVDPIKTAQTVNLFRDFGDQPLGRASGHRFRAAEGKPPRSLPSRVASHLAAKATRLANAITPNGVRADARFRMALRDCSHRVGDLLQLLVSTADDPKAIVGLAGSSQTSATAAASHADEDPSKVLDARLRVHLDHMDMDQLKKLERGLTRQLRKPLDDAAVLPTRALLERIEKLRTEVCAKRAGAALGPLSVKMVQLMKAGVDHVAEHPGAAATAFASMRGQARVHLENHGLRPTNAEVACVHKEVLADHLAKDMANTASLQTLLKDLPASDLQTLLVSPGLGHGTGFGPLDQLVLEALENRLETTTADIEAGLSAFEALLNPAAPAMAPTDWLNALAQVIDPSIGAIEALRRFASGTGRDLSQDVARAEQRLALLVARLTDELDRRPLPLHALDHRSLVALKQGLDKLGLTSVTAPIIDTIEERKQAARAAYGDLVGSALTEFVDGRLDRAIKLMMDAEVAGVRAVGVYVDLGESMDGAEDLFRVHRELVRSAVARLTPDALARVVQRLGSPEIAALRLALRRNAAAQVMDGRYRENDPHALRGKQMGGIDIALAALLDEAATAAGLADNAAPDDTKDDDPALLNGLTTEALQVLMTMGVDPWRFGPSATPEVLDQTARDLLRDNLAATMDTPFKPSTSAQADPGVDDAFWKDLPRARYLVEQPDGLLAPLINADTLASQGDPKRTAQLQRGVDALRGLATTETQLATLTKVANQNLPLVFEQIMAGPESPIRYMGVSGYLTAETPQTTYTIRRSDDGALRLKCDRSLHGIQRITRVSDDERIDLDPRTSGARFSLELRIAPDGTVSVVAPPALLLHLNQATKE